MKLCSSFHARLFSTGRTIVTDYGRTFLFCVGLAAVPEVWYRGGTALVVTDPESLNSWTYTIIRESYQPLMLLAGILGGIVLVKAYDEGTDKVLWIRETVSLFGSACYAGLRAGGLALGCLFVAAISSLSIRGLLDVLEVLSSIFEPVLGSSLATVFSVIIGFSLVVISLAVGFIATIWAYVASVTVPVRHLVLGQSGREILSEEWDRIFSRIPDYLLWVLVLKLLFAINSGYTALIFTIPMAYLAYLTVFLTEARRMRGEYRSGGDSQT